MKTKTISTALQAANAPVGVHKIAGVSGLYLKIGETSAALAQALSLGLDESW